MSSTIDGSLKAIATKNIDKPTQAITTGAATSIIMKLAKFPSGDVASFL
jgi:hypothetical protein